MSVKSQVLQILEAHCGTYVSGEELAGRLSCSRAAVWKAVKALREEGYVIDSGTNRGYAMGESNDILSAAAIERYSSVCKAPIYVYKEVSSTNDLLKEKVLMGKELLPHGTMVLAEHQTNGKGHSGKSFASPGGDGIYMSVLLRPQKTVGHSLLLSQSAAVAVHDGVEKQCGVSLEIKWVNDLLYEGRKVCGILTEAVTDFETGEIDFAVVGMGVRLYGSKEEDALSGSIFQEEHPLVDRNALTAVIRDILLQEAERETVSDTYRMCNIVPGRKVLLVRKERREPVKALEILRDGSLLVEHEHGICEQVYYGEVQELEEV